MSVSPHFTREEFECSCGCGFSTVDVETVVVLEAVRVHFGKPVYVTSAARCPTYNRSIGSTDTSQHTLGRAVDFHIDVDLHRVYDFIDKLYPERLGLGIYTDFIHVDSRDSKARWDKT